MDVLSCPVPVLPDRDDPEFWGKVRAQFPMPVREAYCNTGTVGASPLRVLHAVVGHLVRSMVEVAHVDWHGDGLSLLSGYGAYEELRSKVGKLINSDYRLIALTQNATMGMNILANGLDFPKRSRVVVTDIEHPGGRCGWELLQARSGVKLDYAKITLPLDGSDEIVAAFEDAFTPETRLMSFPHISSEQGIVFPAKELCSLAKEHGVISVIDGAQATGHIKVDVMDIGCDAYYSSPHKWLMAPAGNGILYVAEHMIDDVWTTLASSQWDNHEDNGYRLGQRGTGNPALLVGFNAALGLHFDLGPDRVYGRIKELGDHLRAGLGEIDSVEIITPTHPGMCAGLTTFRVQGIGDIELQDRLWSEGRIQPRALRDNKGIRYSTHIYNNKQENNKTHEIIKQI